MIFIDIEIPRKVTDMQKAAELVQALLTDRFKQHGVCLKTRREALNSKTRVIRYSIYKTKK